MLDAINDEVLLMLKHNFSRILMQVRTCENSFYFIFVAAPNNKKKYLIWDFNILILLRVAITPDKTLCTHDTIGSGKSVLKTAAATVRRDYVFYW